MKRIALFLAVVCAASFAQNNARMLSGVNLQTTTSYPFVALDATRLTVFSNNNPILVTLPPGNVLGFGAGTEFDALNLGPGTATITCSCLIYSNAGTTGSSTLPLTAGQGVQLFASGLNYYALVNGSAILGLLSGNNVWTGSNTYNGAVVFGNTLQGITVLGAQGGAGGQGYIQFGTGAFTQNTLARFDSSGDLVNSFYTDSGAIGAYTGVNGLYSPTYNTNGTGPGFVGITQGTLPGTCNGGVNTFYADTITGLMVICDNVSSPVFHYLGGNANFFDATNQSASIGATILQSAAPGGTEWVFKVNLNQVSHASCTNAAGGQVVVKAAYTDSAGLETPTVATLAFTTAFNGNTSSAAGSWPLRVSSTNNISFQATWTNCTTGTGSYDIHAWLERVK